MLAAACLSVTAATAQTAVSAARDLPQVTISARADESLVEKSYRRMLAGMDHFEARRALAAARLFRQAGLSALLLDTSPQPQDSAQALAQAMGAAYVALPHAGGASGLTGRCLNPTGMGARMDWQAEGYDWPHHSASRFVEAGGLRWHVQQFTATDRYAPVALLIHGTGASTHSWRTLAPLLRAQFQVLTVDLPGHAFTGMPSGGPTSPGLSLPGMARSLSALLAQLKTQPALVVGHSAGAAIAVRMCLDGLIAPRMVASLNGALVPLGQ
eukprot:gene43289-52912_t